MTSSESTPSPSSSPQSTNLVPIIAGSLLFGAAVGLGIGFTIAKSRPVVTTEGPQSENGALGDAQRLFEFDGKVYGADDVPGDARDVLFQIQNQAYDTMTEFTKQIALRVALASEQSGGKVDMQKLPQLRDLLKETKLPESELKKFYDENKKGLPPGTTYEQVKPQIEQFLLNQKVAEISRQKVADLEKSGKLKLLLTPPQARPVDLDLKGYPTKGAEGAQTTLVEVADFMCPHCRHIKPEVDAAAKDYGSKLKIVYVPYALRPGELSGDLARGAYCANQQGNDAFWKYSEKAYEVPLSKQQPGAGDVKKQFLDTTRDVAKDAGLDMAKFEPCLTGKEAADFVDHTVKTMNESGVTGTPTFFLNKRKLSLGARTLAEVLEKQVH